MQRIWIIGASSGIGRALAEAYAGQGAELLLSARTADEVHWLAAELPSARALPLDISDAGDLASACAEIGPGKLDAVLCTAALYDPGPFTDLDLAKLNQILEVNLKGTFLLAKHVPELLRQGGQLVLFGSVAGYIGLPNGQPYSATKAAIINLAESLRIELAPHVDVRLVNPGFVRTRLTDKNDFNMPMIISPDTAAAAILKGLRARRFEIHFPRRFTLALKLLRILPYRLSLRLTRKLKGRDRS